MLPDLGKYGGVVFSAYGATVLLLLALVWLTWVRSRRIRMALEEAERRHKDAQK